MRAVSPVRFFDADLLELARWISMRYVTPLAEVLGALSPPRVASEEGKRPPVIESRAVAAAASDRTLVWESYTDGPRLASAIGSGRAGAFVVRPAPEDEQALAVAAVRR